jgi:type II secretory pathway pseudopilin PulG
MLLEVIIALTIFTMVALALVLALDASFRAARERNEVDVVVRGLENQLELLHAGQIVPVDEDLPDDGSGIAYHLLIDVEQIQDQKGQSLAGVYRATVSAKWKSDGQVQNRDISELLYQP